MVQDTLLKDDGKKYRLSARVVMPNHVHMLVTRFENYELSDIMQAFKSITSHKANKALGRKGSSGCRSISIATRTPEHYKRTVKYIENNLVKARLCSRPEDYRFSSAWFRKHLR